MKRIVLITAGFLLFSTLLSAQEADGIRTRNAELTREGANLAVKIGFDLSGLHVASSRAVLLTPRLIHGTDTLELSSVGIYGRRRYFYYLRNDGAMLSGTDETTFRAPRHPDSLAYAAAVPYEAWMDGSSLVLERADYGCCRALLDDRWEVLAAYDEPKPYVPFILYVRPTADMEKVRSLSGSAFIDFPVDRTEIHPDYRRNTVELAKIEATIDSVRNDSDVTITSVWLKGYASPESPYAHNRDLAIGRTAALKRHIGLLYHFPDGIIQTDYEPEDWAGLRRYVEASNLPHREQILAMIDSGLEPDAREWKIKSTYPEEYRILLRNCYPALRHTDYRIEYMIRSFSDPEEILRILRTQPQKLNLNEIFIAAQAFDPGSPEFASIFETAVRLYPNDPTANLNAANTALEHRNLTSAEHYLSRAGSSAEAEYARGVYHYLCGRSDLAREHLQRAAGGGIPQAGEMLRHLEQTKK